MRITKSSTNRVLCCIWIMVTIAACEARKSAGSDVNQLNNELSKINTLLRDTAFAAYMAGSQESSYSASRVRSSTPFFEGPDSVLRKSFKEEKIAINLAGFYAVECGIGSLIAKKGGKPTEWLERIANQSLDSSDLLLLNRFANATWKAGQPFRSLDRIRRDNFIVAGLLSDAEINKDTDQVTAAAIKLLDSLKGLEKDAANLQLEKIGSMSRDKGFAIDMARHMEEAYLKGQNKPITPFLSPTDDTALVAKSAREELIATKIAGFYALECGIGYLSVLQQKLPSSLLQEILTDRLPPKEKELFERFANATWKAGQPFRSLDRITRPVFMPFDLLSEDEKEKDWVQIKAAAEKLMGAMK